MGRDGKEESSSSSSSSWTIELCAILGHESALCRFRERDNSTIVHCLYLYSVYVNIGLMLQNVIKRKKEKLNGEAWAGSG